MLSSVSNFAERVEAHDTRKYLMLIETPYVDPVDAEHFLIEKRLDEYTTDDHASLFECMHKLTSLLISLAQRGNAIDHLDIRQDEFDYLGTWYCETSLGSLTVIHLIECNCLDCKGGK